MLHHLLVVGLQSWLFEMTLSIGIINQLQRARSR